MRARWIIAAAAGAALSMTAPAGVEAQGKSAAARAKQPRIEQSAAVRTDSRRDRDWERQRGRDARPGPSFCRDGSGHPVKGRQWCRDKGFALGRGTWERRRDDVILRQPPRRSGRLGTYF